MYLFSIRDAVRKSTGVLTFFVNKYDASVVADISSDNRSSGRKTVISCIHYQHERLIIHNVLTLQKDHASCM